MEPSQAPVRHAPCSPEERVAIRKQLERMLANSLFKNSKRYPNLLRYVVEHTLEGDPSELKERRLGVQVFGREPDYDTNADPIVRATAGEIRKRIAQYYHEQGHEAEIRIELLPGSYVPEFGIFCFVGSVVVEPTAGHVIVLGAGVLLLFVILALVPWRWEVTGGLLLVVMSVIVGVTYAIASAAIVRQDGSRLPLAVRVITTVVFTGPPLVAGTLFLVHHRSLTARA